MIYKLYSEKHELKKQENQVEYQEKLSNVKDLFN